MKNNLHQLTERSVSRSGASALRVGSASDTRRYARRRLFMETLENRLLMAQLTIGTP